MIYNKSLNLNLLKNRLVPLAFLYSNMLTYISAIDQDIDINIYL